MEGDCGEKETERKFPIHVNLIPVYLPSLLRPNTLFSLQTLDSDLYLKSAIASSLRPFFYFFLDSYLIVYLK